MTTDTDILTLLDHLATGPAFLPKVSVTRDVLARAAAEIRKGRAEREAFDLTAHLKEPSRDKPLAAAAAVNMRKHAEAL